MRRLFGIEHVVFPESGQISGIVHVQDQRQAKRLPDQVNKVLIDVRSSSGVHHLSLLEW